MTDRGPLYDQSDTPEDVATLYSWANLHGAKYRDFSEARAQTREKARQRVQQAIEEEQARLQRQAQAERQANVQQTPDVSRVEEEAQPLDWTAQIAAIQSAKQAQQQAELQASPEAEPELLPPPPPQPAYQPPPPPPAWQPLADRFAASIPQESEQSGAQHAPTPQVPVRREELPRIPPRPTWPGMEPAQTVQVQRPPVQAQPVQAPAGDLSPIQESHEQPGSNWGRGEPVQEEQRDIPARPAWLTPERPEESRHEVPPPPPRSAEETLQGSRDRLASRWYALRGVFDGVNTQPEPAPTAPPARPPVVSIFSLAGGVGKTSLAATLGRALSGRGERILLVDTAPYGLMPFFFGAHDQRPGVLRTFSPPGASGDAPIQMVTIDPETLSQETPDQEALNSEITALSRGVSRIIIDLATASGATTRRVLGMSPLVLVPLVPDMNSVVSVSSIDSFFLHNANLSSKPAMPFYVLSQFDSSLPLHLDIREILREQLGDRLLTLSLRRSPAVSEALAEGMTVMDYAPNSTVAEDFVNLAGWVKSQSAPASSAYRGVRWSER